ncbi:MAG TPA: radical SAM protein [Actinospica sp.]|jgi:MoaA/NifB/PqqE/SkfB family radical SAM enzyme|nr:radical SAM protein [Actinospica sp.]
MRNVTLLWAPRSRCKFQCPHCYFGEIEEHRINPPTQAGILSHLSRSDVPTKDLLAFARTLADSPVERVVIAGGEPLDWPDALDLISVIKEAGCQVVIATNGVPLTRPEMAERLVALGVDGVSVSLDSADAEVNDQMRPGGRFGYRDVLAGIETLLQARGAEPSPKVGIYTVVTRSRPNEITDVAQVAAGIGVDYFVPQPISLAPDHQLFQKMCHNSADVDAASDRLIELYDSPMGLTLPDKNYIERFIASISTHDGGHVPDCFGGARLFFIQPDGSVWDCPSDRRIAATPPDRRRTIHGADARELFAARPACTDCTLFSRDCVNMWPLVLDMPRLLNTEVER